MSVAWKRVCPADSIWTKRSWLLLLKKMEGELAEFACARFWMPRPKAMPFVQDSIAPGSVIHTDGWPGYLPLERKGYKHDITIVTRKRKTASDLLPRVHQVVALLKRWLIGTHQGAVSHKYLDYYLDEFTFRFNRRSSKSRGKLFFRLAQQAVAVDPAPYERILCRSSEKFKGKAQSVAAT